MEIKSQNQVLAWNRDPQGQKMEGKEGMRTEEGKVEKELAIPANMYHEK